MPPSNHYSMGVPFFSTFPAIYWLLPFSAIFILLLGIAVVSRLITARRRRGDEETLPLLIDNEQARGYDTIPDVPATTSEQESSPQGVKARIQFVDTIKSLIPYFWPQNMLFLQLVYVGIGICLFIERVLKVLIPLQLAQITNILTHEPNVLPWKEIMLFIGFHALCSKGGLPAARGYLWLPLDKYSYSKISMAAFDKIMLLSSDTHDSEGTTNLWGCTGRGLSIRYAFRSALFQLIPTIVDLGVAAVVLTDMFGVYMALIISVVVIGVFGSSCLILPKQFDKCRQMADGMDREYSAFCEWTSNWQAPSCTSRMDDERARYNTAVAHQTNSSLRFFRWLHLEPVVQSLLLTLGLMGACLLAAYQIVYEEKPVGCFAMLLGFCVQLSSPIQLFTRELRGFIYRVMNAGELVVLLKKQPPIYIQNNMRQEPGGTQMKTVENIDKRPEISSGNVILPEDVHPDGEGLKRDFSYSKIRKGSSGNTYSTPSRSSIWKPDAPEFIPASQRSFPKRPQMVEQNFVHSQLEVSKHCPERYGVQKENVPVMPNNLTGNEIGLKVPASGESKVDRVAQKHHDSSNTNVSREFGSEIEPNADGVILMSPKKLRKKTKGLKKKQALRRQFTKSEPAGVGLIPF
ncbi:ABC transporter transmembrane region [Aspergillus sclerotialis]|uniref:ABC transporter transmembrane region n=1 Tax=Aspergillus sclerotialis TaxID=2070753 RepID=A0A3A2ZKH7_9EURO|nr:ABC transporter transmembrane region [Aspergillus sclerotialis]